MANRTFTVKVKLKSGIIMDVKIEAPNQMAAREIAERSHGKVLGVSG